MVKQLNRKGKKKGFTLIELVIVLAVLAIIALIAIPNFTRVRNNALVQADYTTCEQITNITQTSIAEGLLEPQLGGAAGSKYTLKLKFDANGKLVDLGAGDFGGLIGTVAAGGASVDQIKVIAAINSNFIDVKAPQVAGKEEYEISISKVDGRVSTQTTGKIN
ncbi:MAG: prepilin-type N-terminal cleavage/methylation domain-containing protein [Sarcina sp.]